MLKADLSDLPKGWFDEGDIEWYRQIYEELVPECGNTVEVGCYRGRSICSIADIILRKNIQVLCVDCWRPWDMDEGFGVFSRFNEALSKFGLTKAVESAIGLSCEVARTVASHSKDFIFIDADHNYESVKADLEAWEPKLKRGAYIGGHDYMSFPGVTKAVNERYKRRDCRVDSSIWLAKPT